MTALAAFGLGALPVPPARNRACARVCCAADVPVENLVIIGSGPAGFTSALYAGRANLKPVLLEGLAAGVPGGQLMTTAEVENYPGFDSITGPALMANMRNQALRWGAEIRADDATALDLNATPFTVRTASSGPIRTHAIIVATGASARRLGIAGEERFWSQGISCCAICDGAAPIFQGVEIVVVGGGDSACEEAVFLNKFAKHVHLLVRGDKLRASKTLQDRVLNHPSVTVHFNTVATEALGFERNAAVTGSPMRAVRVRDMKTSAEREIEVRGMFYAIGHVPNTAFLKGASPLVRLDGSGYLVTKPGAPTTGLDGVFAAGDVADPDWRQAVTAAGSGCTAALAAERYLSARGLAREYHHESDTKQKPSRAAVESQETAAEKEAERRGADNAESYSIEETWHTGQYALRKLYHESTRPLLVMYGSPLCGPCGRLKPMLHGVVRALEGQVHYVEIDITVDQEVAASANVTGSPTVQCTCNARAACTLCSGARLAFLTYSPLVCAILKTGFMYKSLVKEFKGVKMKSEYRKLLEQLLEDNNSANT